MIVDPYSTDLVDLSPHSRKRRGFWEGIEFDLASPAVDWQMMLGSKKIGASFGIIILNTLTLKIGSYTYE